MIQQIAAREFRAQAGVEDWRVVGDGACTYVRTGSFEAGARLVQAISELPGLGPHQPDIDLRHDGVTVRLVATADDYMGMSTRDVELAREISRVAREQGLSSDPTAVESVLLVIDAMDIPAVMRFWRALLDYDYRPDSPDEDLIDRHWRWPGIWFEQMDVPRPQRNRIHVAVWVPIEQAEARVAAAIAAGGHLVTDQFAPMWWVLADPEGNEADVATILNRD
jgi:4a-hydroxytetrahydrobiopterin dehydratase